VRPLRAAGVVAAVLLACPAWAAKPSDSDCLTCHGEEGATRADGRLLGRDLKQFPDSVHGLVGASCVDCHVDLAAAELPHAEKLAPAQCTACHAAPVEQHAQGVHARTAGGQGAQCVDCHGAHGILPFKDPNSPTHHLNVTETCARCHADAAQVGARAGIPALFADSIHGQALTPRGLVVAPNCATCHGAHGIRAKGDPRSRVHRGTVAGTCGTCHEGIRREYEGSVHAAAVKAGGRGAVCSDCHTAHAITATVPAWRLDAARECGTCHEESSRTYRDGFHGQAGALGYTRVATCADCHGSHGIKDRDDPASRVSAQNRVATCSRCHPGANARFAAFDPHADPHDRARSRPVYYTALFMKTLLAGVFAFFGIHTALWFPRSWKVRRHGQSGPPPAAAPPAPAPAPPVAPPPASAPPNDGPKKEGGA
jgi:nitrate/TMAO reductase-like tetraheme cytochrome c subunit